MMANAPRYLGKCTQVQVSFLNNPSFLLKGWALEAVRGLKVVPHSQWMDRIILEVARPSYITSPSFAIVPTNEVHIPMSRQVYKRPIGTPYYFINPSCIWLSCVSPDDFDMLSEWSKYNDCRIFAVSTQKDLLLDVVVHLLDYDTKDVFEVYKSVEKLKDWKDKLDYVFVDLHSNFEERTIREYKSYDKLGIIEYYGIVPLKVSHYCAVLENGDKVDVNIGDLGTVTFKENLVQMAIDKKFGGLVRTPYTVWLNTLVYGIYKKPSDEHFLVFLRHFPGRYAHQGIGWWCSRFPTEEEVQDMLVELDRFEIRLPCGV